MSNDNNDDNNVNDDNDNIPILPSLTKAETEMVNTIANAKKQEEIENDPVQPIGLYEELSPEDYAFAMDTAKQQLIAKDAFNQEKNLERDLLTREDQNFCVVNWVGPTFKAKTDICGFRIMGAFKTLEKAQKYAQNLHNADPTYDTGIMEMYLWCLGYPSSSDIILDSNGQIDISAMEKERDRVLNDFIVKHKTKLEESKQLFEIRKRAVKKSKLTKEGNSENAPIQEVPTGVPTEEMKMIHNKEAEKWVGKIEKPTEIDENFTFNKMLDFDTKFKIPNQEWAVISFVGYTGANNRIPICIKGIYPSEEDAINRINQLIEIDDTFDIVPMPLYKWVPCDPDLSTVKGIYKEKALNNLIETSEKQHEESLSFHQIRKKYEKPEPEPEPESTTESTGDDKYEYKIQPKKILFDQTESAPESASDALIDIVKYDTEDIRTRGKMYYEHLKNNNEVEPTDEEIAETFTLNLTDKDIKEPMFKKQEEEIRQLEEKIKSLVTNEGISEQEARGRFRIKFEEQNNDNDNDTSDNTNVTNVPKPKPKAIDLESMSQMVDRLKKEGKSVAEIRKIMSEKSIVSQ